MIISYEFSEVPAHGFDNMYTNCYHWLKVLERNMILCKKQQARMTSPRPSASPPCCVSGQTLTLTTAPNVM